LNRDIAASRLLLFLDTCFAGVAAGGARALVPAGSTGAGSFSGAFSQFSASGWAAIAASRGDQQSWESDSLKQGYFTYYLLEALRESQGRAPVEQLFQSVRERVSARVKQELNVDQVPVMSAGSDGAKLVLGAESKAFTASAAHAAGH
jgi:uncharacterized caspase-like protein